MRYHDTPAVGVRVLSGLDGLGQGTDLVDLEQESIACLRLDGLLDALGVGHGTGRRISHILDDCFLNEASLLKEVSLELISSIPSVLFLTIWV